MKYEQTVLLKDGREALIRNGDAPDGQAAFDAFNLAHAQTDFLLTYPDENSFTAEQEAEYLKAMTESDSEVELVAVVDGAVVGLAGIEMVGKKDKVSHRAQFGISVVKEYWGLGLGRAMAEACIVCAKKAGYAQIELDVVADNERALSLYKSLGFVEFGRNPRGFKSRYSGYQELVYMLLRL